MIELFKNPFVLLIVVLFISLILHLVLRSFEKHWLREHRIKEQRLFMKMSPKIQKRLHKEYPGRYKNEKSFDPHAR